MYYSYICGKKKLADTRIRLNKKNPCFYYYFMTTWCLSGDHLVTTISKISFLVQSNLLAGMPDICQFGESILCFRPVKRQLVSQLNDPCYSYLDFPMDYIFHHPRNKEIQCSYVLVKRTLKMCKFATKQPTWARILRCVCKKSTPTSVVMVVTGVMQRRKFWPKPTLFF